MIRSKKCSVCGYEFTFDDKVYVNPLVAPHDDGARYYYNLWHFFVEKCPECGYACSDISSTRNKDIVKDDKYLLTSNIPQLKILNKARPNRIADYIYAGTYYESIEDTLNEAKCMLQASDLVYAEMMYWEEYVLDSSTSLSAIQNKAQYNEFKKFADNLFNIAIELLEEYHSRHPEDIDATILLGGALTTGDKIQKVKGATILSRLKGLSNIQAKAIEFLLNRVS